jgi:hypothetical protein
MSCSTRYIHARDVRIAGSPVGGVYAMLLALAMPFVSPERLVCARVRRVLDVIVHRANVGHCGECCRSRSVISRVCDSVRVIAHAVRSSTRPMRQLWSIALAVDVCARIVAMRKGNTLPLAHALCTCVCSQHRHPRRNADVSAHCRFARAGAVTAQRAGV